MPANIREKDMGIPINKNTKKKAKESSAIHINSLSISCLLINGTKQVIGKVNGR
jgi:hypothetical protein